MSFILICGPFEVVTHADDAAAALETALAIFRNQPHPIRVRFGGKNGQIACCAI